MPPAKKRIKKKVAVKKPVKASASLKGKEEISSGSGSSSDDDLSSASVSAAESTVSREDTLKVKIPKDLLTRSYPTPQNKLTKINSLVKVIFKTALLLHIVHALTAAAFLFFTNEKIDGLDARFRDLNGPPAYCAYLNDSSTDDQRDDCKEYKLYQSFLAGNGVGSKGNLRRQSGIPIYSVMNGVYAVTSFFFTYYVFHYRFTKLEPKTTQEILNSLFKGFPQGTIMISYAWKDETPDGALPRQVASFFPCRWLDIDMLVPGSKIQDACRNACTDSLFRFAFLSKRYLASPNCTVEWEVIKKEPGKAFLFCYDDLEEKFIKGLEKEGHICIRLTPETRKAISSPDWFLQHFVQSGIANGLFHYRTPAINEYWLPTLRFWFGHRSLTWARLGLPGIAMAVAVAAMDFFVTWYYKLVSIFTYSVGNAILFGLALILPTSMLLCGIYLSWYLYRTGFSVGGSLPDSALLFVFLSKIGAIKPVKIYSNDSAVVEQDDFKSLLTTEMVEVVDEASKADLKILLLDALPSDDSDEEVDNHVVLWTKNGFMKLSDHAKNTYSHFLIGDETPNVEFLATKMIMNALKCQPEGLTVGAEGFKTLSIKGQES